MSGGESRTGEPRDLLADDLRSRLRSAMETGVPTRLTDTGTAAVARDLTRMLTSDPRDGTADIEAIGVLVAVHWTRWHLLPDGEAQDDLDACLAWSAVLLPTAPDLVPEPIRTHLTGVAAPAGTSDDKARAFTLYEEYRRTGNIDHLQVAVTLFEDAVDATPPGHPDRPAYLSNLGIALRARFGRTGQPADLDHAVTVELEAIEATPPDHPDRPAYLSNLGNALLVRFRRTGHQAVLDQAVAVYREAIESTPSDHPDRSAYLSNLGIALRARFGRTGQPADLDHAVTVELEAIEATPPDHPHRPAYLSNLGIALRARFERTGQQPDLDQAITVGTEAVAATPPDHPNRPVYLTNLGGALRLRFERTGQQADLDRAITVGLEAVAATPPDHPNRPGRLSNLGVRLQSRFERTGQQQDLEHAIAVGLEAVAAIPTDHPERPMMLSNLGGALRDRFERTGQLRDLDQAVALGREAVAATPPDHPGRPGRLSNLGVRLQSRFERTGQQQDLEDAIAVGLEAVAAIPTDHPYRPLMLSNFAGALRDRFDRTGQLEDLDRAITAEREAVEATPAEHPARPRYLVNLGSALETRFERSGRPEDLDHAVELYREGSTVATAPPWLCLLAAWKWGRCPVPAGRGTAPVEAYEVAVGLLPLMVWHGLDQPTKEHHLRESAGLASEAAAAAIAAGDPRRAVELAEAARAMLWTQAQHLRQDLTDLRRRAPHLAAALEQARHVLDHTPRPADDPDLSGTGDEGRAAEQQMLAARRQAARDWDTAVEQVRRLDGFQHFLQPVPFADLRPAATAGPVVIVTVSPHGSHALIVTSPTDAAPEVVDLPTTTLATVTEQADILLDARSRAGDPTIGWTTQEADRLAVLDVLAWTWHAITEPVLTALGHTTTPAGPVEDWPRVWWCPTGPAAVLPLHAAGIHPRHPAVGAPAADSVAERVVSSYTPTLTALARARARPAPGPVRALAVGVPDAPGYVIGAGALPAVLPELHAVAAHLPPPDRATHLVGATATRDQVLHGLPRHSWLHLSCHGFQHPDASRSAFLLHDQPLTLTDLAAHDLPTADLAYLAACQTATGDVSLLDEALHLAAALQLVGYRHVLATLWSISDTAAPAMAHTIYAHLTHPDPDHPTPADHPDSARAPYALHHAVTHLRRTRPSEPLTWAPYIHLGP